MTNLARGTAMTIALASIGVAAIAVAQTTGPAMSEAIRVVTPSGLTIIDQGMDDLTVQPGDTVWCHYTGRLADGTVFDSSKARNDPFHFQLGVDGVIKGWAEGITGMRAGQKRQLIIPPALGYGDAGQGSIPGGATLTFDIEVLYISRSTAAATR